MALLLQTEKREKHNDLFDNFLKTGIIFIIAEIA